MNEQTRLQAALKAIDEANAQDPNTLDIDGVKTTKELLYGQRMSAQLEQFTPLASTSLQIAARAQHIQRWLSPRSDYPQGREGYKRWRADLGQFHAETTAKILAKLDYSDTFITRVSTLLGKKGIKRDEEVQTLEDVICLVFLEHYLSDFARKHSDEKLIDIIQKTWRKMSEAGHEAALKLPIDPAVMPLITRALQA
jgi:hypothetical protein